VNWQIGELRNWEFEKNFISTQCFSNFCYINYYNYFYNDYRLPWQNVL